MKGRAYLLIDKATGEEHLVDGAKYDPTDLAFWVDGTAQASYEIIPLNPPNPPPENLSKEQTNERSEI